MLTEVYFMITLPFIIVTPRGFPDAIPADLEEAALVDGRTRAAAFRRVLLLFLRRRVGAGMTAGAVQG